MQIASRGVQDTNVRVRYAGLSALAMLFTELAPKAQIKYHAEVLPVLVNLMISEPLLKMQTQATSAVLNFVQGLFGDENEESKDEETPDCRELMSNYTKPLLQALVELLKKGIQAKHEPL